MEATKNKKIAKKAEEQTKEINLKSYRNRLQVSDL